MVFVWLPLNSAGIFEKFFVFVAGIHPAKTKKTWQTSKLQVFTVWDEVGAAQIAKNLKVFSGFPIYLIYGMWFYCFAGLRFLGVLQGHGA